MDDRREQMGRRTATLILVAILLARIRRPAAADPMLEPSLDYYGRRICYWRNGRRICRIVSR